MGCSPRLDERPGRGTPFLILTMVLVFLGGAARAEVTVHFFWSEGCGHCREMAATLDGVIQAEDDVVIHRYEVSRDPDGAAVFGRVIEDLALPAAVPIVVVGDQALVGHAPDSGRQVADMIAACRAGPCPDHIPPPPGTAPSQAAATPGQAPRLQLPGRIEIPLIGEVRTAELSLPALTIALAAIDGVNPCAMWVLVFLVGLLLGNEDRRRMWLLAGAFLAGTAAVYFLVLAAWLNALLVLGQATWLRLLIAGAALLVGGFHLRQALRREAVCEVTAPVQRRRVFEKLRNLVQQPNLAVAITGVVLLAFAVNLVEFLCSAGVPAVYTAVLAQAELPASRHYAYLALYVLVFLADDAILAVAALWTLSAVQVQSGYTRWARLAGAIIMIGLAALLIVRPGWMSFA